MRQRQRQRHLVVIPGPPATPIPLRGLWSPNGNLFLSNDGEAFVNAESGSGKIKLDKAIAKSRDSEFYRMEIDKAREGLYELRDANIQQKEAYQSAARKLAPGLLTSPKPPEYKDVVTQAHGDELPPKYEDADGRKDKK